MQVTANTILITGGSSGIGLELTKAFMALGNTVVITGRDPDRLKSAVAQMPGLVAIESDAGNPQGVAALYAEVVHRFPKLNVIINNAGLMRKISLHDDSPPEVLTQCR